MSLAKDIICQNLQWLIENEKKYLSFVPVIAFIIGGIIGYQFWKS